MNKGHRGQCEIGIRLVLKQTPARSKALRWPTVKRDAANVSYFSVHNRRWYGCWHAGMDARASVATNDAHASGASGSVTDMDINTADAPADSGGMYVDAVATPPVTAAHGRGAVRGTMGPRVNQPLPLLTAPRPPPPAPLPLSPPLWP